jgi:organic radical activating enzyme
MINRWIVKKLLDFKGPGFCLEKWGASTLHLATGQEHGCHHCSPVQIDESELVDPSVLFNHTHKRNVRKIMLEGGLPAECSYCHTSKGIQDRIIQSSFKYNWFNPNINKLTSDPRSLEVSFSNVCNMACTYCGPNFSSKWHSEIESHGEYPNGYNKIFIKPIPEREENPYVEAFWKYWPTIEKSVKQLRITGGEPLLSKHTYNLIDKSKNIPLTVNTNLSVETKLIDKLLDSLKNKKNVTIATSGESTYKRAEYSRHGLDYEKFLNNLQKIKDTCPRVKLHMMSTYNVFCVSTFTDFLKQIKKIDPDITLHITRLTQPQFLTHRLIDGYKEESMNYISKNFENESVLRFKNILLDDDPVDKLTLYKQFYEFIKEFDSRRNVSFSETFPEYEHLIR